MDSHGGQRSREVASEPPALASLLREQPQHVWRGQGVRPGGPARSGPLLFGLIRSVRRVDMMHLFLFRLFGCHGRGGPGLQPSSEPRAGSASPALRPLLPGDGARPEPRGSPGRSRAVAPGRERGGRTTRRQGAALGLRALGGQRGRRRRGFVSRTEERPWFALSDQAYSAWLCPWKPKTQTSFLNFQLFENGYLRGPSPPVFSR